ncbi:unnamed protein product [Rhodiola kirilowii]
MRMLSWNCRGVGGPRAIHSLCDVVRSHRPSIVGLIETKKADGNWDWLRVRLGFAGSLANNSRGGQVAWFCCGRRRWLWT